MELNKCTQEEGVKLLKIAGYEVLIYPTCFQIFDNQILIKEQWNLEFLENPTFLIKNLIRPINYSQGFNAGKVQVKEEVKSYLGL